MLALIFFLILLWLVAGIIGVAVHGLIWLTVIAAIFFVLTLIFSGTRLRKTARSRRRA